MQLDMRIEGNFLTNSTTPPHRRVPLPTSLMVESTLLPQKPPKMEDHQRADSQRPLGETRDFIQVPNVTSKAKQPMCRNNRGNTPPNPVPDSTIATATCNTNKVIIRETGSWVLPVRVSSADTSRPRSPCGCQAAAT